MINIEITIDEKFTNDIEFICGQCNERGKCFTVGGETLFCPSCGSRIGDDSD